MRRRVGPPEGYARFEGGRHKEAYWTSKTLRAVVRDLLLFEIEHGREHAFWSRERLAKLDVEGTPMSRGKGTDTRDVREAKKERKARTVAAAEQRHLRSELLGVVGNVSRNEPTTNALPMS